jgi:hypothetical protein
VPDADLADIIAVGDHVQLPKPLVLLVQQHHEAATLCSRRALPSALPAVLQPTAALLPLLQVVLAPSLMCSQ